LRGTHLVEVKDQIQLTNIPKERIQNLYEEMYCLQIRKLIIICVHTGAEEKSSIAAIDDLGGIPKFDEVGLVLLVARGDETVDLGRDGKCLLGIMVQERDGLRPLT
jgi:hypothetical protein